MFRVVVIIFTRIPKHMCNLYTRARPWGQYGALAPPPRKIIRTYNLWKFIDEFFYRIVSPISGRPVRIPSLLDYDQILFCYCRRSRCPVRNRKINFQQHLMFYVCSCYSDQPNRPTLSLSNIKPLNFVEDIDVSLPLDQQW